MMCLLHRDVGTENEVQLAACTFGQERPERSSTSSQHQVHTPTLGDRIEPDIANDFVHPTAPFTRLRLQEAGLSAAFRKTCDETA